MPTFKSFLEKEKEKASLKSRSTLSILTMWDSMEIYHPLEMLPNQPSCKYEVGAYDTLNK